MRDRASSFGDNAELYDRTRPRTPTRCSTTSPPRRRAASRRRVRHGDPRPSLRRARPRRCIGVEPDARMAAVARSPRPRRRDRDVRGLGSAWADGSDLLVERARPGTGSTRSAGTEKAAVGPLERRRARAHLERRDDLDDELQSALDARLRPCSPHQAVAPDGLAPSGRLARPQSGSERAFSRPAVVRRAVSIGPTSGRATTRPRSGSRSSRPTATTR